jgi:hypothetical protein
VASAVIAIVPVLVFLPHYEADTPGTASAPRAPAHALRSAHPAGTIVGCARRSEANFPGAFTSSRNLVVGPLVLIGAAYTPPSVAREFGGNKFPLLVKAGHRVTVSIAQRARRFAGLAYGGLGKGPLPQGKDLSVTDAAYAMTFVACPPGPPSERYEPEGPSGSYADVEQVTFWSGFVLARSPRCVPLDVYADGQPTGVRVGLALGRRCPQ